MKRALKKIITNQFVRAGNKLKNFWGRKSVLQDKIVEDSIVEGVKSHAKVYSGLYEPMHWVAFGRLEGKLGVFDEWCLRSGNINDGTLYSKNFVSHFSDFRNWDDDDFIKNAQLILRGIAKASVVRDSFRELVVDGSTCSRYSTLDGRELKEGETLQVLMPCWYKDDLVLEKGILK